MDVLNFYAKAKTRLTGKGPTSNLRDIRIKKADDDEKEMQDLETARYKAKFEGKKNRELLLRPPVKQTGFNMDFLGGSGRFSPVTKAKKQVTERPVEYGFGNPFDSLNKHNILSKIAPTTSKVTIKHKVKHRMVKRNRHRPRYVYKTVRVRV